MTRKDTFLKMIRLYPYVVIRVHGTETFAQITKKEARRIINFYWKQIDDWTLELIADGRGLELVHEEGIAKQDQYPSYLVSKIS